MSTRVLITGGTGFVGRHVLNHLAINDVLLTVISRDGKQTFLGKHSLLERVIKTTDLFAESEEWWENSLQGIDIVIHLAWFAEPGKYLQSPKNMECLQGTLTMAKGAALAGVRRFVGIGTCFEYDLSHGLLSIETPLKPLTLYAAAKAATYMSLSHWLPAQGVEFAWCRIFYLYGEGEDTRRLVPYIRAKLEAGENVELTSGNQIRDFLNANEAGRLIANAALSAALGPVNICSGIPVTVKQFAESIADEYKRRDLLAFGARAEDQFNPPIVVGKFS